MACVPITDAEIDAIRERQIADNAAGWRPLDIVHGALDVAGFIPGLGAVADVLNAGIYLAEGDYAEAAWAMVAAVPGVGDAAKAARMAKKAAALLAKHGDEVAGGNTAALRDIYEDPPGHRSRLCRALEWRGGSACDRRSAGRPQPPHDEQGYGPAELDRVSPATLPYANRHADPGYQAIRGREQQMIDRFGGAASDRPAASMSGNSIRGVAADNPLGPTYHDAAYARVRGAHPYTGN